MPDLVIPKREELSFRKNMLENEKTMAFRHGTVPFPESEWDTWMDKWILHADPLDRFYRFVFCDGCNDFVALCGWEKIENKYQLILIVDLKRRNVGYGTSIVKLLAEEAKSRKIESFYAKVYLDNSAIAFLKKCGFEEVKSDLQTVTLKTKTEALSKIEDDWK